VLVYLIPADAEDADETYAMLRREIEAFSPALAAKPHCVALSKADLVPADKLAYPDAPEAFAHVAISALARQGLDAFLGTLWQRLAEARREAEAAPDVGQAGNDTSEAPPARSGPGTESTAR
jgi:GTP-binding protein